jgi:hypothetical protein
MRRLEDKQQVDWSSVLYVIGFMSSECGRHQNMIGLDLSGVVVAG